MSVVAMVVCFRFYVPVNTTISKIGFELEKWWQFPRHGCNLLDIFPIGWNKCRLHTRRISKHEWNQYTILDYMLMECLSKICNILRHKFEYFSTYKRGNFFYAWISTSSLLILEEPSEAGNFETRPRKKSFVSSVWLLEFILLRAIQPVRLV